MVRAANAVVMEALERGGTVVTANRRLARYLRAEYARLQMAAGRGAWETPKAVSAGRWLRDCWERVVDGGLAGAEASLLILTPEQESLVWESVVRGSDAGKFLISAERTAAEAARAYRLFHDYRIERSALDGGPGDASVFAQWMAVFDSTCEREGWLPRVRLSERLAALVQRGIPVAGGPIHFVGFDSVTPALTHLKKVLQEQGVDIQDVASEGAAGGQGGQVVRVECATPEEEWDTAARWARARLEQDPDASVCVVVPDLAAERSRVIRAFRRVLEPRSLLKPDIEGASRVFNVSVGGALGSEPMVRSALLALRLTIGQIPITETGSLLRSPYIGGADAEGAARARLDGSMRGWGGLVISGRRLATEKEARENCPDFVKRLDRALSALNGSGAGVGADIARTAGEWAEKFAAVLDAFGWPAVRPLTSREWQTLAEWRELLAAYETLGCVVGKEPISTAVARLSRLAQERIFQPQSPETRLQILGGLEAGGLEFDAVWVTGLHDGVSPGAAAPNPFLPVEVQARVGISGATAGLRAAFSARVIQRLLTSAPEVVVSHARRNGDVAQRPSPFVAHLPAKIPSAIAPSLVRTPHDLLLGTAVMETVDDTMGPPIARTAAVYGGAYRVKQHSDCPFRAFAQHRLGAEEFDTPTLGLSPMERGSLTHAALEAVWRRLRSSKALRALLVPQEEDDDIAPKIKKLVAEAVRESIRKIRKDRPDLQRTMSTFWDLEFRRLLFLICNWLIIESIVTSGDFEVVLLEGKVLEGVVGVAEPTNFEIGGLAFSGRVDRVDRLPDGQLIITDYKTGSTPPSPRDWEGARPAEPQLLLYATAGPWKPEEIARIQFAIVSPGKMDITHYPQMLYADLSDVVGPSGQTWLQTLNSWRRVLDRMGREMSEGYASVDPREGGKVCRNCPLPMLCRVASMERAELREDSEDDETLD
ncbi:MAG: PD-(D/E)XK nuclease family protein [Candidatus Sumerlaeaceae bacterium]|nr:PD-(D/E)XK nuclease family protein [Candidatus Sumerlaeaceae bacterium]